MSFESSRETVFSRSSDAVVDQGLRAYMVKVYNYMTIGLLMTSGVSFLLSKSSLASMFFNMETGQPNLIGWLAIVSPIFITFMISSATASGNASKAFTLFMVYSGLMGVSMTSIFWVYTGASVVRVFLITAGTFAGMSLYGYTTNKDLTKFGSFLYMALIGIVIASLVNLFLRSESVYWFLSYAGVFLFVGLTAFDTWKIKNMYNENDQENAMTSKAIFGALMLYLDFINLFMYLLRFFGSRRD